MPILPLAPAERDPQRIVYHARQLAQGRSDAVGWFSLATGGATSTVVQAPNCSATISLTPPLQLTPGVFLSPQTAHAAAVFSTTFVNPANVKRGQFTVTHAATANADCTFWFEVRG